MTLDVVLHGLAAILLLGGCALATIGLYGLLLKPDIFEQMHVAGLISGPAVVLVLLASLGTGSAEIVTSAILVAAFVLVTSSISTHVIAHAAVRRYAGVPGAPPQHFVPAAPLTPVEEGGDHGRHGLRVVIAYDGSAGADVATALARSIDWPAGTIVRLVSSLRAVEPDLPEETALAQVADAIGRPQLHVETAVVHGDPADTIVDEAEAFTADLLITGSRRRGFVQSLLGWSASGEIVDRAPCPVLVARMPTIRQVLLTTDGSVQSDAAADIVARWGIFDLARVRVVTVAGGAAPTDADQRTVDRTAALLMDAGRDVVTEILQGRPAPAIVDAAKAHGIDLIVIGSRGRTGLGRTLLGSVAGEVLASADASVLIVAPRPRRPPAAGRVAP
ncbi:MAG TPA: universal stress protein [Candidatus Limnocylindrales bacterium]|nr:universal stress protein [Candidatus Limnocylindrales bacterium]